MRVHERRRVVLATAFTVIALPAIWLFDRNTPTAAPTIGGVGVPAPEATAAGFIVASTELDVPVFLDNNVVVVAPAVIDIALPDAPGEDELDGTATFKQFVDVDASRTCSAPQAPSGASITVTNVNNGLSITCTNTHGVSIPYGVLIGIDTDVFIEIADLVDSPVPVRIAW